MSLATRTSCLAALCAFALAPRTQAQPIDAATRDAIAAANWPSVLEAIKPLAATPPTGECAYWRAVALGESGDTKNASAALTDLWAGHPADKSITIAALRYASVNWIAKHQNTDFGLALIDTEVARALVLARVRVMKGCLQSEGAWVPAAILAASDQVIDAYRYFELTTGAPDPEIDRWAGFAMRYRGDLAEAVTLLTRAVQSLPASWDLDLDLAIALVGAGQTADADARFARARSLASKQATDNRGGASRYSACNLAYGAALEKQGLFDQAVLAYRDLIANQPGVSGVRQRLGLAAYRAGDVPLALWAFNDSLDLDGIPDSAFWLGRAWYELGEYDIARVCIEQAITRLAAAEQKTPSDMEQYLGRALFGTDKKDDALKHLEAAFALAPGNIPLARWYFQASLAADDRYGAIEICRRLAAAQHPDEAREGLDEIMRRWPLAVLADMAKKKPMSHVSSVAWARADIDFRVGRYHEAVEALRSARSLNGPRTHCNASWMLLLAGDTPGALQASKDALRSYKDEYWPDMNRLAQGVALIRQSQWADARAALAPIKNAQLTRRRDVAAYYAAQGAGTPDSALANSVNALGIIDYVMYGDRFGLEVLCLLPGSPFEKADTPILPRDRIVSIEGFGPLGSNEALTAARALPLPAGPARVTVYRDGQWFDTMVDFSACAAALAKAREAPR